MARYEHLTIYKEIYSLSVVLFSVISRFPRDYKFSLWNRILDNVIDLLEWIVLINSIEVNERKNLFLNVEKLIIKLNLLLNISNDLKIFWKEIVYLNCIENLVKIKKLKRGWEKN